MNQEHTQPQSTLSIWWLTLRPATLWAGAAPVIVGSALAYHHKQYQMLPSIAALFGALLIQIACNLVNDYSDFEKGADTSDRLGPARAAAQGWLSVEEIKRGAYLSLILATCIGVYLIWIAGLPIFYLGVASLISAIAYTAGPWPLAYLGLGDLFVMIFFGFGAVAGTYYVQTLHWHPALWSCGWSVGAIATCILVVNNLRDHQSDQNAKKHTLAVRFGPKFARWEYTLLMLSAFIAMLKPFYDHASYCQTIESTQSSLGAYTWCIPLILLPLAIIRIRSIWRLPPSALNPLLGQTAQLELLFCLLLSLALVY